MKSMCKKDFRFHIVFRLPQQKGKTTNTKVMGSHNFKAAYQQDKSSLIVYLDTGVGVDPPKKFPCAILMYFQ